MKNRRNLSLSKKWPTYDPHVFQYSCPRELSRCLSQLSIICTESQLTVLKRCMEMQAAFLWKHKNNNTFVDNQTIFKRLDDKRNWISEWAKIEKSIPENLVKKLKSDDNEKINKSLGLKIDSNLNIRNHNDKIIVPKEL